MGFPKRNFGDTKVLRVPGDPAFHSLETRLIPWLALAWPLWFVTPKTGGNRSGCRKGIKSVNPADEETCVDRS